VVALAPARTGSPESSGRILVASVAGDPRAEAARLQAATTGVFLVPAVARSNPVTHPYEFGFRPGDPDHTLAHGVRARGTCGGTSLPSKCLFSQPRGGHRSRFRSSRLATNRRRAAIERGEEVDAARRLDTERPVAPIRVRLADWFERALRREQSVPASRV
jgi:hypothetical protein